jgi:ACT domain-containing protein
MKTDIRFIIRKRNIFTGAFYKVRDRVMEFNTTFNNITVILWRSVLLMEET